MRRLPVLVLVGLGAALVLAPVAGAQTADDELAGYVGTASGAAFSIQPIFPGLLPTGDAPFEVTGVLTTANAKSGGNAFGQAAAVWPGSAAANLGPLLGTAASQPALGALIPPYPAAVSASQDDGVKEVGADPGPVLRASGKDGASTSTARAAAIDVPGVLHIDVVTSISRAAVVGGALVTETTATLGGVTLGDGTVTIASITSTSRATSNGTTSTSTGTTALAGLKVAGQAAELSSKGLEPAAAPLAPLTTALEAAGIQLALVDSAGRHAGGAADRVSSGLTATITNPAAAANPQFEGSRFVVVLAPTAVGALASPPFASAFDADVPLPALTGSTGFSTIASTVTSSFGGGSPSGGVAAGGPVAFEPARRLLDPVGGVPGGVLVALLAAAVFASRWISRFVGRLIPTEE